VYNPLKIPVEQLNELEGTIEFAISKSNLFDESIPLIRILEIAKSRTVFILERDSGFNLRFIQSNPSCETKIAEINIRDLHNAPKLFVAFTWSEKENTIYVGDYRGELRSAISFTDPNIKFRVGKDGAIYQIGDKGVQVGFYRVKVGEKVILESTAKELFDFQMEKIRILIENCEKGDFLFESTLAQQIIVMLVTAFETYAQTRFVELEEEGKVVNMEELYDRFIPKKYREQFKEEIKEVASRQGNTELELFIERRQINFQDWESFKDGYNKGYGLKIGEIGIPNDILLEVQKFIKWRHKIIHSKGDQTMINFEEVPPKEPIFTNKDLAEKGLNIFQKFINELHKRTLKL
jgi:hypothetical protein